MGIGQNRSTSTNSGQFPSKSIWNLDQFQWTICGKKLFFAQAASYVRGEIECQLGGEDLVRKRGACSRDRKKEKRSGCSRSQEKRLGLVARERKEEEIRLLIG